MKEISIQEGFIRSQTGTVPVSGRLENPAEGYRNSKKSKRGLLALPSALVVGLLSACGSGGDTPNGAETGTASPGEFTAKPTLVETAGPTAEVTSVITASPTPDRTAITEVNLSKEEILQQADDFVNIVSMVVDAHPGSESLVNIIADVEAARDASIIAVETENRQAILDFFNGYGNVASDIGIVACFISEVGVEGKAWGHMRDYILKLSDQYVRSGILEEGMTETLDFAYFGVPAYCVNPIMLTPKT